MTAATMSTDDRLIGVGPAMQALRAFIPKVAPRDCNVLITGETGTGKERVAEAIHASSPRSKGNFVCVNCAAVPDTLLESELFGYERGAFTGAHARFNGRLHEANGGTVFLDEIGDMSPISQAKILRAIEQKVIYRIGSHVADRLDIRIIAATNQDLPRMVIEKRFRSDLYYRLNVVNIQLPPLRERLEDVTPLFAHYMRQLDTSSERAAELSTEALAKLLQYDWPGNIRELRNLVELLLLDPTRRTVLPQDLPEHMRVSHARASGSERERLLAALSSTQWNRTAAAKQLHCSRMTLYRKMVKYQLADTPADRQADR